MYTVRILFHRKYKFYIFYEINIQKVASGIFSKMIKNKNIFIKTTTQLYTKKCLFYKG